MFGWFVVATNAVQLAILGRDTANRARKTKLGRNIEKNVRSIPETQPVKAIRSTRVVRSLEDGCSKLVSAVGDQLSTDEAEPQKTEEGAAVDCQEHSSSDNQSPKQAEQPAVAKTPQSKDRSTEQTCPTTDSCQQK